MDSKNEKTKEENKKENHKEEKQKENNKEENKKEEKQKENNKKENNKKENNKKENKEKEAEKNENKNDLKTQKAEKSKNNMKIFVVIFIIFCFVMLFSIIFALININRVTYISGINVKGIDISGLTLAEAKNKIEETINKEMDNQINIIYKDEILATINPEEIEFNYDLNRQLKQIHRIGRNGNIFKNNYEILITAILKKNIELEYTYNEEKLNSIIENMEPTIPGLVKNPSYYIEGSELIIVPGEDGIILEKEKLKQQIINHIANNIRIDAQIPVVEEQADDIDLEKIQTEIYKEPKNAYYIEEPFELFLDEDGIDFAITLDEAEKIISVEAEEYKIPLKITKAQITINDIDSSAFKYEISTFSTTYDAGYRSRANNLELAAKKINGKVLRPGEIFSFNEVVGKRTIEAGYTDAKIFANGKVIDGTGGGICQISTTLYNAVLLANLEIVDRRNHTYTTSYIKAGRDATVVYGSIDFKFRNNRKYPVKIEATVKGGVATFNIYGIQEENEYEVKIIPVVTQTMPKTTQYIDDETLVEGSEVVQQVGSSGCKVTTYKETYLNGSLISKEVISNDVYKVMQRIVKRGTKKASVPVVSQPVEETPPIIEQPAPEPEISEPTDPEVIGPTVPEVENSTI